MSHSGTQYSSMGFQNNKNKATRFCLVNDVYACVTKAEGTFKIVVKTTIRNVYIYILIFI